MNDGESGIPNRERARLIAVGVDGFAMAASMVQYAIELAAERPGRVLVVAAYRVPDGLADLVTADHARHAAASRIRWAMSRVRVPPRMQVDVLVAPGDPARVLAEVDASADVLVIGRHQAEFLP